MEEPQSSYAYWENIVNMIEYIVQEIKYIIKHMCSQILSPKVNDRDRDRDG